MTDLLQQNQFTVTFNKISNTVITLQTAPIPSVAGSHTNVGTPFSWIKEPDTKGVYSPWNISFKLDENLDGYLDIFNWWQGLYFPHSHQEYRDLKGNVEESNRRNIFSDATVNILDNTNHLNVRVNFRDMFPTTISEVPFKTDVLDAVPIDVTATFEYQSFTLEKIT
jgi:hypothetical protein